MKAILNRVFFVYSSIMVIGTVIAAITVAKPVVLVLLPLFLILAAYTRKQPNNKQIA